MAVTWVVIGGWASGSGRWSLVEALRSRPPRIQHAQFFPPFRASCPSCKSFAKAMIGRGAPEQTSGWPKGRACSPGPSFMLVRDGLAIDDRAAGATTHAGAGAAEATAGVH